jgi:hypothetical protein
VNGIAGPIVASAAVSPRFHVRALMGESIANFPARIACTEIMWFRHAREGQYKSESEQQVAGDRPEPFSAQIESCLTQTFLDRDPDWWREGLFSPKIGFRPSSALLSEWRVIRSEYC